MVKNSQFLTLVDEDAKNMQTENFITSKLYLLNLENSDFFNQEKKNNKKDRIKNLFIFLESKGITSGKDLEDLRKRNPDIYDFICDAKVNSCSLDSSHQNIGERRFYPYTTINKASQVGSKVDQTSPVGKAPDFIIRKTLTGELYFGTQKCIHNRKSGGNQDNQLNSAAQHGLDYILAGKNAILAVDEYSETPKIFKKVERIFNKAGLDYMTYINNGKLLITGADGLKDLMEKKVFENI